MGKVDSLNFEARGAGRLPLCEENFATPVHCARLKENGFVLQSLQPILNM